MGLCLEVRMFISACERIQQYSVGGILSEDEIDRGLRLPNFGGD